MLVELDEVVKKHSRKVSVDVDTMPQSYLQVESKDCRRVESELRLKPLYDKYKVMDLSFLKMRRKDGWPVFACFNINQAKTSIEVSVTSSAVQSVDCTCGIARQYYEDFFVKLGVIGTQKCRLGSIESMRLKLESEFSGILPTQVRKTINESIRDFDYMMIVREAEKWTLSEHDIVYAPAPDPLVIGVKNNVAFLVDKFDLTKVEDYVSREFQS